MRTRSLAAVVGATVALLSANTALAQTPSQDPIVPATTETTMVTLFGTGINLSVGVDGAGNLTSVELTDAAGAVPPGAVATEVSPHEVKFIIGDNATEVEVEARGRKIKTEVEANALAELVGTHTWSGELFGTGNGATEITFSISDNGGDPVVDLVAANGLGTENAVATVEVSSDGDEVEAKLRVELVDAAGNQARFTVKVEVEEEDDGRIEAELKITVRSDLLVTEDAVGPAADPTVNTPIDPTDDDDDSDDRSDDDSDDDSDDRSDDESDDDSDDRSDDDSDDDDDDDSDDDESDDDDEDDDDSDDERDDESDSDDD